MYSFKPQQEACIEKKIRDLLNLEDLKKHWQEKSEKLIKSNIDLTDWMVNMILEITKKTSLPNS